MAILINLTIRRHNIRRKIGRSPTISNVKLLPVQPDEIIVTHRDSHFQRIHGDTQEVVNQLKDIIGNPKKVSNVTIDKNGIVFVKRQSNNNKIWTFKEADLPAVAELLKRGYDSAILEKVQPGEVSVTQRDNSFQRILGSRDKVTRQIKDLIGDPEQVSEITNDKYGICFTRRRNGCNKMWTFKEADLPAVAGLIKRVYDTVYLENVKSCEVLVARNDKHFQRIHGRAEDLVNQLKDLLGDPEKVSQPIIKHEGIILSRRISGSNRVWVFNEADLPAIATLLKCDYDLAILEKVKSGEILVARNDKYFQRIHGATKDVLNQLKGLLGDPEQVSEITNDKYGITFTRRYRRSRKAWAFNEKDLYKVAGLLRRNYDSAILDKIQPGEISITQNDNSFQRILGSRDEVVRQLKGLLGDPEQVSEITNDKYGITFTRRRRINGRKLWTLKESDLPAVAGLLKRNFDLVPLHEMKQDEISVANSDINFQRIQGITKKVVRQLKDLLGDPE
ncbi:hypothetical protein ACFL52_05235, partial [Candidatus Margulisiibacteriota bacterium]